MLMTAATYIIPVTRHYSNSIFQTASDKHDKEKKINIKPRIHTCCQHLTISHASLRLTANVALGLSIAIPS